MNFIAEMQILKRKNSTFETMLKKIIVAQKRYEMNPCWSERTTLKMIIHEIAADVYPEMKWLKD